MLLVSSNEKIDQICDENFKENEKYMKEINELKAQLLFYKSRNTPTRYTPKKMSQ